jgi:hypothetical protein
MIAAVITGTEAIAGAIVLLVLSAAGIAAQAAMQELRGKKR